MPRLMSVAYTEEQVRAGIKDVTRRTGWRTLIPGTQLDLCRKVMGRRNGEPLVRLRRVIVLDVRRESLLRLTATRTYPGYGAAEMIREGFPGMAPGEFVRRYFTEAQGVHPSDDVTRIEWEYLPTPTDWPAPC